MISSPRWADELDLRAEVVDHQGQLADLQMSLFEAVYQTRDVPYRDVKYFGEITQPTPGLVGFMADVAVRLGTVAQLNALFHLDQGMGGGKSHALTGLWHMASNPREFFNTEVGAAVHLEAEQRANGELDLRTPRLVVLSADHMSPGSAGPEFGPATTLHERFLWALFEGDADAYRRALEKGPNKAALKRALERVGGPVLILLDELMDYALALSSSTHIGNMPIEQGFLNALMDAVDEVSRVVFVVVMIRSELDERGYNEHAEDFRDYIAERLERNGLTAAVSDAQDFSAIIRRRIFEAFDEVALSSATAKRWSEGAAGTAWIDNVFDRLPSSRGLLTFEERLKRTFPFHPDLMALVRDDWSQHAGFQRVRSTVAIFAATAFYWIERAKSGAWAPELIGPGDIPLEAVIEEILSSGLLHGNEKAVQGFRQVAATDVVSKDVGRGRSVELDATFSAEHPELENVQPSPCRRIATALFMYSLVPRAQARRGATKPELLSAVYVPEKTFGYVDADEALSLLTDPSEGLGALDQIAGSGGSSPTRYVLTITQTLRMFYRQAKSMVRGEDRDAFLWARVQDLASKGLFNRIIFVPAPESTKSELGDTFADIDESGTTRIVVLDPRTWSLLDGRDTATREDIEAMLGVGQRGLRVDNAASVVVVCINAQRRETARKRASDALAYQLVERFVDPDDEVRLQADEEFKAVRRSVDEHLRRAFQHFAYLVRAEDSIQVEYRRFDLEAQTALSGNALWDALGKINRAVRSGVLSGDFLRALIDITERPFTVREIVERFWQDARFPLVSDVADVRRALFEAITTEGGWEIVDESGEVLTVLSPDALAINSLKQVVRPQIPRTGTTEDESSGSDDTEEKSGDGRADTQTVHYKRYKVNLPSRSLAQPESRKKLWHLLSALADATDPQSGADLQLLALQIEITAAMGQLAEVEDKAEAADARWTEEDEDF